jgi:hypothetical protein
MSVDYLTEDPIVPPNQKFVALSLWMNDDMKSVKLLKVNGAFSSIEEVEDQLKIITKKGHYNFYMEVGKWGAFDPLPNNCNLNDQLNDMMKRHLVYMHKKTFDFEQRKYIMIINNLNDNIQIKQNEMKDYEQNNNIESATKTNNQINELMKKVKEYKESLEEVDNKINNMEIDTKYENSKVPENFNQNVPLELKGTSKRQDELIPDQNWYCVSFLSEVGISLVGIKISGLFDTEESGKEHSLALRTINDSMNILVGKTFSWMPFNPEPDSIEAGESEYADPTLNDTMKKKKENEHKAKLFHEYRKYEEIKKNINNLITNKKKELDTTKETNDDHKIATIDDQIAKLEAKMKEYDDKSDEIAMQIDPNLVKNKYLQTSEEVKEDENKTKTMEI